ncbi:MAG TPA: tetratricopeptide repeat protein [Gaiellaceae bacterium]|nr:tetratricopeptide repeat protein [Gaiellaceae bacterium]
MTDLAGLARRLKEARERAGLSQRQLAFPGCSAAYISRVEAGDRVPSPAVIEGLASRLGVSAHWLTTGDQESAASSALRDAQIALRLDDVANAERLFGTALDGAESAEGRSEGLEGLAEVAVRKGTPRVAIEFAEQALGLTGQEPEERPALAEVLARSYAALGELARSIAVLERCVEHFASEPVQFVRFSVLLGAALTDGGNFAEAERVIGGALARGRELIDPYTRARLYWSESRLLQEQGNHEAAEDYARRTLEILRATEDGYAVAHILQMLAHINIDLGRPDEALVLLSEGWPAINAVGTPLEVAQYQIEEARALAAVGDYERASALATALTQSLGDSHSLDAARAYLLLAETMSAVGQPERALELYELAIDLLEQGPPSRHTIAAYRQLATLLKERGDSARAYELMERALGVQEQVGRPIT